MSLSVMTWNIWFENLHYETRMREIFRQCSALKPDIIAFRTAPPLCCSPCAHPLPNQAQTPEFSVHH